MPSPDAALEIRTVANDPVPIRVRASGAWTFSGLKAQREQLAHRLAEVKNQPADRVAWDLAGMVELDDAGAVWLAHALRGAQRVEVAPRYREMLKQVSEGMLVQRDIVGFDPLAGVVWTGRAAAYSMIHLRDGIGLLGQLAIDIAGMFRRPRDFPLREFSWDPLESTCRHASLSIL